MHSSALKHLFFEENIQLPVCSLYFLSLIGHGIAQWKKTQTKAIAFIDDEN
jgi:hypothetical protein